MGVLELVCLNVLPQGLDDARAGLSVNAQQTSEPRVQLKLGWLEERENTVTQETLEQGQLQNHTEVSVGQQNLVT